MSVVLNEPGFLVDPEPVRSRGGFVWQTIRRRPSATIGIVLLSLVIVGALLAPWVARIDDLSASLA